mmetsp:Transcript_36183/g.56514  ORF Transcript_36183/g.56514 Transcript_36183/m.56514 type:complete len:106 (+) Transcript_36183:252-569(+)
MVGYMVAHFWPQEGPAPALGVPAEDFPEAGDIFIHDVSLLPKFRRRGICRHILKDLGGERNTMALVAVQGAENVWEKLGFKKIGSGESTGYGKDSHHMKRESASL